MKRIKKVAGIATIAAILGMYGYFLGCQVGCSTIEGIGTDLTDAARWTAERLDRGFNRPEQVKGSQ
jgi:hypothetical protein